MKDIEILKSENVKLRRGLFESERRCKQMERAMKEHGVHSDRENQMVNVFNLDVTRSVEIQGDKRAGLLWNFSDEKDSFEAIDKHFESFNHVPRTKFEHPVALISERELETVSYPIDNFIKPQLEKINAATFFASNIIGHIIVSQEEIEITAGFAGSKGNLLWVNTGDVALRLKLKTGDNVTSVILDPSFGFSLGKRERFTRVFLSRVTRAADMFIGLETVPQRAHATFFGTDVRDEWSWLERLNSKDQAVEYKPSMGFKPQNRTKLTEAEERHLRLGIKVKNSRRDQIRIAPLQDCVMQPGLLSKRIDDVRKWVQNALRQARSGSLPQQFKIIPETEKPRKGNGEPFEVLWIKFEFDDIMWDDELMWDIRYLLMGSKMDRIPGFPDELDDIRRKLFVSRDGFSERRRGNHRG